MTTSSGRPPRRRLRSALAGAMLTLAVGLSAWAFRPGQGLSRLSYDLAFAFGGVTPTNEVVVIVMDEAARLELGQAHQRWQRSLHARLLEKLAAGECRMTVFDVFFAEAGDEDEDEALARALKEHENVLLAGDLRELSLPGARGQQAIPPYERFTQAVSGRWGIPQVRRDTDGTVRRHAREEGQAPGLFWLAARLAGATEVTPLTNSSQPDRWIRYYRRFDPTRGPFERLSYHLALAKPPEYFRNKIVFVGGYPITQFLGDDPDEYRVPYTRWDGVPGSGVEIGATLFLNLVRGDWLERLPPWIESLALSLTGLGLGIGLALLRPGRALAAAVVASGMILVLGTATVWSYNTWFPWMIIAGAQIPAALLWSVIANSRRLLLEKQTLQSQLDRQSAPPDSTEGARPVDRSSLATVTSLPVIPDYELLRCVGQGAYGEVWLARDRIQQLRAAKVVYRNRLPRPEVYEREFRGIAHYVPLSLNHSALLHVVHVGRQDAAGYYYCVMEAADDQTEGDRIPCDRYQPRDLAKDLVEKRRLPIAQCAQLAWQLTSALAYLHDHALIHRDIKPSNIIFVHGQPKLADIGLVSPWDATAKNPPSYVGTLAYMAPEGPTSPAADVYGLGKVMYQASTGLLPHHFPEMPPEMLAPPESRHFYAWRQILLQACAPQPQDRYRSGNELRAALADFLRHSESGLGNGPVASP